MTTTLEILNHCLSVIGENPVSNTDSDHPAAVTALNTIMRVSKEVQTRGWWFNKEYNLKLIQDGNNEIILPSGTLKVTPRSPYSYLVRREGKLYDPAKHSFALGTAVFVDVTLMLDIDDLPETAAQYINHLAAYDFFTDDDGEERKASTLGNRVAVAWSAFKQEELRASRVNSRNRPFGLNLRSGFYGGYSGNPAYPGGRV